MGAPFPLVELSDCVVERSNPRMLNDLNIYQNTEKADMEFSNGHTLLTNPITLLDCAQNPIGPQISELTTRWQSKTALSEAQ